MSFVDTLPYFLIVLAALGGFSIALYIWAKKRTGQTLVCPVGTTCDTVIHSEYSKFFGVPVELLGIGYYGIIALSYALMIAVPALALSSVTFFLLSLTLVALLFSGYLTFIQAFALRQWCTWCLISAGLCTFIFTLVIVGSEYTFLEILAEQHSVFVGLHLLAVALGLGGATISDIMFFKFLKDLRISEFEANILHTLSQIIWFALALFIISGLGLYLPEAAELNQSAKFLVKMVVVGVIIVNGAFLNLSVAPNLVKISFGQSHEHIAGELRQTRKLAYALGAVSIVSWYSAFLLGFMRSSPAGFGTILAVYIAIVIIAIGVSQLLEQILGRRPMTPAA